jgi:hypothetical protein
LCAFPLISRWRWNLTDTLGEFSDRFFSRTVLFSTLAAFASYWAVTLYLSWNPVYLVTVRYLRLSDPLYLAGTTFPYIV